MLEKIWRSLLPYVVGLTLLLLTLGVGSLTLFYKAVSPHLRVTHQMTRLAEDYAKLTQLSPVMTFHGQETYYSVLGQDDRGQTLALLMAADVSQTELIPFGDKLTISAMQQRLAGDKLRLEDLSLGRYEGRLVWQVKSQLRYYLYDVETGELLKVWG